MHIIAHRGFKGRYPEMSPLAYEQALTLPIHGVECDVRLTRDGQVVCTHDRTMQRGSACWVPPARPPWDSVQSWSSPRSC